MTTQTGMPNNVGQIYDAVLFKGENSYVIEGSQYRNGKAVRARAPGTVLLDTNELPVGSLTGINNLYINWHSANTTDLILRVEIYSGEDEVGWDEAVKCESSSFNYGTELIYNFNPYETHRIIISSLTSSDIFLDYIKITPVAPGTILSMGRPHIGGEETLTVMHWDNGTVTGNGTPSVQAYVPFLIPFSEPPTVVTSVMHGSLKADPVNIGVNGFTMQINSIFGANWSSTQVVQYIAIGKMIMPFVASTPK